MSDPHQNAIWSAMRRHAAKSQHPRFRCECGAVFYEKKSLAKHRQRKECEEPAGPQLKLFGA